MESVVLEVIDWEISVNCQLLSSAAVRLAVCYNQNGCLAAFVIPVF